MFCGNPGHSVWILKECGLGIAMQTKLNEMQNEYMIQSDPNLTSCRKCHEIYSIGGDMLGVMNPTQKGPNGKPLSIKHQQHKAKY